MTSQNQSRLHNPNPQRRPMDRPNPHNMHDLQLVRVQNLVARHRKLPLQR
jgi:hypothetical protein